VQYALTARHLYAAIVQCLIQERLDQRGLADPRVPNEKEHLLLASICTSEQAIQPGELLVAAKRAG
jgi:hypothetical protein